MAEITLQSVSKQFDDTVVIPDISLTVDDGQFAVFVGPSGCGKSTLLRIIAGLEKVSSGDVLLDGNVVNDIAAADRGLAMVFQSYALYPHMTVYKNMSFGLENTKLPQKQIDEQVKNAAELLQITPYLQRLPKQLSGGQRQRVAIGRAIVRQPKAFLFDEPLSNLDAELRVAMRKELATLHDNIGGTMIYVTHDQTEAMTLADKIVVLRDGKIEQQGNPLDLYNQPCNKFVAGFIGSPRMNLFEGTATVTNDKLTVRIGSSTLSLPQIENIAPNAKITLGVRPEHFDVVEQQDADITATVALTEQLGGETFVYANAAGLEQLTIHHEGQLQTASGAAIHLRMRREELHIFAADDTVIINGIKP